MIIRIVAKWRFYIFVFGLMPGWAAATASDMAAPGEGGTTNWLPLGLESYEPSAFGYTKNNDDVHFENFKISVQFPFMPHLTSDLLGDRNRIYFSFTGVFAFYIGDRYSGPVVGQEYNPQLFWRHLWSCKDAGSDKYTPNPYYLVPSSSDNSEAKSAASAASGGSLNCYIMLGYNHDSNGQIIDSQEQFLQTARQQGLAAAYDSVSRGWDYIGIDGKFIPYWGPHDKVTLYPMLKYFLADGLLQGNPEELHYWEHPTDAKPRRDVDGLSLLAKYQHRLGSWDTKVALGYTTGYEHAFQYNTERLEAGVVVKELPIVFWVQNGYVSDLSRYYHSVRGYGVQVEIGSF